MYVPEGGQGYCITICRDCCESRRPRLELLDEERRVTTQEVKEGRRADGLPSESRGEERKVSTTQHEVEECKRTSELHYGSFLERILPWTRW